MNRTLFARRAPELRLATLAALCLAAGGCSAHYRYTFHLTDPGATPAADGDAYQDADLAARLSVDPGTPQALALTLTNKTDQVAQVEWAQIVLREPDGSVTSPRPEQDLGWLAPGASETARLIPFAVPVRGAPAAAMEGKVFTLELPMIVRREPKKWTLHLSAHVEEIK